MSCFLSYMLKVHTSLDKGEHNIFAGFVVYGQLMLLLTWLSVMTKDGSTHAASFERNLM